MKQRLQNVAETVQLHAHWLLPCFVASLVVLNWGRWSGWGIDGFALYGTQPIMQTTLYDFAWVLGILTVFIHQDAKKHPPSLQRSSIPILRSQRFADPVGGEILRVAAKSLLFENNKSQISDHK